MTVKIRDNGIIKTFNCKGIELAEEKDAPDYLILSFANGGKIVFGNKVQLIAVSL